MRLIIIFFFFSTTAIAQNLVTNVNIDFPERNDQDSIKNYINLADSLWVNNNQNHLYWTRKELKFSNNAIVHLAFDSTGIGERMTIFYPDTIAIEIKFLQADSSYSLNKYDWYYGMSTMEEFWVPNKNLIEFWYYGERELLETIISIQISENKKTVKTTKYKNFKGRVITETYSKNEKEWVLVDKTKEKEK